MTRGTKGSNLLTSEMADLGGDLGGLMGEVILDGYVHLYMEWIGQWI